MHMNHFTLEPGDRCPDGHAMADICYYVGEVIDVSENRELVGGSGGQGLALQTTRTTTYRNVQPRTGSYCEVGWNTFQELRETRLAKTPKLLPVGLVLLGLAVVAFLPLPMLGLGADYNWVTYLDFAVFGLGAIVTIVGARGNEQLKDHRWFVKGIDRKGGSRSPLTPEERHEMMENACSGALVLWAKGQRLVPAGQAFFSTLEYRELNPG
ncbi:MAG: hypothetical protein LBK95_04655 [Bifidobacteriaceae bacterium]|jgi:hypothetical protein|nr:hypothetical protein [Bifidobacteriaceae bacterium]